ncbi:MAG: hypothetical protein HRT57_13235 [Crocinitomicaceae bacterium]|nr:hypothetical protein [Crocinitomicaceae bacterium]
MVSVLRPLIEIEIPDSFNLVSHEFYNYDPKTDFSEIENLMYLNEDLFQATFEENDLIVDFGWYGNVKKNDGQFMLKLIQNNQWDNPVTTIPSSCLDQAIDILERTMMAIHNGVFSD